MNVKQAYQLGVASGEEAAQYGDFTPAELADREAFLEACSEICQIKRQYSGHPGYAFNRKPNAAELWDSFDDGEATGARKGWRARKKKSTAVS